MNDQSKEASCNTDCSKADDCSHIQTNGGITDIEDYKTELSTLRQRTKELEEKLSSLQTSSTKTLRSAQWLNKPDDLAMSALYADRYMNYGMDPVIETANFVSLTVAL
jgi:dihydroxy-acid dehydratase